jgi:hypothetical protein
MRPWNSPHWLNAASPDGLATADRTILQRPGRIDMCKHVAAVLRGAARHRHPANPFWRHTRDPLFFWLAALGWMRDPPGTWTGQRVGRHEPLYLARLVTFA